MNILDTIAARTRERINEKKQAMPMNKLIGMAEQTDAGRDFPFEQALRVKEISFICEIKKASPSKGVIAEDFPYAQIAEEYAAAGAAAISVLTEPFWFQGDDRYLGDIAQSVSIPLLRKDFTVDEYMIYEAKIIKADAVLLICAILSPAELSRYIKVADGLGLSCLVEAHDESEIEMALNAGARVIGVNNRNLKTFEVDTSNSIRLRELVPKDIIFVSESGINSRDDVELLRQSGVDAVLIGEALMRAPDRRAALDALRGRT
ncbi:MAG: indole-3-glycerol phosphate synthase TrpC [Oscillospiraceae bacterium]|nr:indole-3-glycerol phosphate synthase TrpC [Oscillospiraceae bacterium]